MKFFNNKIIFSIIILVIILSFLIFLSNANKNKENKVCFDKKCFFVEIVDTPYLMERGLMDREYLGKDSGMLFVFENSGNHPFWMKNTLIPLDIIWISESEEVVYIKDNALPCEYDPCQVIVPEGVAKYVLEINMGLASENGIKIGDSVKFIKT